MFRRGSWFTSLALGLGLLAGGTGAVAHAQVGSLIKKKVSQATASVIPAGAPDVYSAILLELKADQLQKVIAGKQAGNAFAASATGPAALREKHQAAVDDLANLRNRNTAVIDAWEERLRLAQSCADSAYGELTDLRRTELSSRMMNDPVLKQKMIQMTPRIAAAQQKAQAGDTTELARVNAELRALSSPTAADSASVTRACGLPAPPAVYTQLVALQQAAEQLERQWTQAEAELARLEESTSGMDRKQLGMACERILLYLGRLKAKEAQSGFSAAELEALNRRVQDLEKLCR
jgi:hypothetical protein